MLLAKWTDFAKASVALPEGGEAGRIKQAVPALIGLQGVTAALDEVDQLAPNERAAGLRSSPVARALSGPLKAKRPERPCALKAGRARRF